MDWNSLPDTDTLSKIVFKSTAEKPVVDLSYLIGAATWTLEEGVNLLATFKTEGTLVNESDRLEVFHKNWNGINSILQNTLLAYELREQTFLIFADDWGTDPDIPMIALDSSTVYPDRFVSWARDLSIYVPDDFYQKLVLAQDRHIRSRKSSTLTGSEPLSAKEKRELGRLRREQENFDLAIKATVQAVQFCIKVDRRVKRDEFTDLLTSGKKGISKELLERILPLLPPEYRETPGAPSICKLGDPNEPEK